LSSQSSVAPAVQMPALQASPPVHAEPSASHAVPSAPFVIAHLPVAGSQVFWLHCPSPLWHVTTVAGLTLHTNGALPLSQ